MADCATMPNEMISEKMNVFISKVRKRRSCRHDHGYSKRLLVDSQLYRQIEGLIEAMAAARESTTRPF